MCPVLPKARKSKEDLPDPVSLSLSEKDAAAKTLCALSAKQVAWDLTGARLA